MPRLALHAGPPRRSQPPALLPRTVGGVWTVSWALLGKATKVKADPWCWRAPQRGEVAAINTILNYGKTTRPTLPLWGICVCMAWTLSRTACTSYCQPCFFSSQGACMRMHVNAWQRCGGDWWGVIAGLVGHSPGSASVSAWAAGISLIGLDVLMQEAIKCAPDQLGAMCAGPPAPARTYRA